MNWWEWTLTIICIAVLAILLLVAFGGLLFIGGWNPRDNERNRP